MITAKIPQGIVPSSMGICDNCMANHNMLISLTTVSPNSLHNVPYQTLIARVLCTQ